MKPVTTAGTDASAIKSSDDESEEEDDDASVCRIRVLLYNEFYASRSLNYMNITRPMT